MATTARLHSKYKTSTTCEYGAYNFGWSDKISVHHSLNAIGL